MPHCEGSKDQCIKYQFFRPLRIFSVFQCCKHLDTLATLLPVCASIGCVDATLGVGETAQISRFNSSRILFCPVPKKSPFWDIGKWLHMWKRDLDLTSLPGWLLQTETRRNSAVWGRRLRCIYTPRLYACSWREDMAFGRRRDSGSLYRT